MKLVNKTILITGGAGAIGGALVRRLSSKNRVIVLDKDAESIEKLNKTISQNELNAKCYICDISNIDKTNELLEKIHFDFGNINVLINNAALQKVGDFLDTEFIEVLNTNIIGTMNLTKTILKNMLSGGIVFNVLSVHLYA